MSDSVLVNWCSAVLVKESSIVPSCVASSIIDLCCCPFQLVCWKQRTSFHLAEASLGRGSKSASLLGEHQYGKCWKTREVKAPRASVPGTVHVWTCRWLTIHPAPSLPHMSLSVMGSEAKAHGGFTVWCGGFPKKGHCRQSW